MTSLPVVRLYGKPGCHLCQEAEAILSWVAQSQPLAVQNVDIASSPALFDEYRYRIPVIEIVGGPSLDWPTTAERVRRALLATADAESAKQGVG